MTGSLHQHYLYLTDLHPMSNNQMAYSNNLKSYCQEHIVRLKSKEKIIESIVQKLFKL